jgi:asparagine synthase (glutamine-hydrolysing)
MAAGKERDPLVSGSPPWESYLTNALADALVPLQKIAPLTVLFSGGVDSGLLAWELRTHPALTLSTVGLEGSPDLAVAKRAASDLNLPWVGEIASEGEVLALLERIGPHLEGLTPTERAVEVAFALAVTRAPSGVTVCGQGADELFFGYAHFRGISEGAAIARADQDLERLKGTAWPRAIRIARSLGREVVSPYLHPRFVSAALGIPAEDRLAAPPPKRAFRLWAIRRGLPESIALRPKKALQYGTGIDRLLRRFASTPSSRR